MFRTTLYASVIALVLTAAPPSHAFDYVPGDLIVVNLGETLEDASVICINTVLEGPDAGQQSMISEGDLLSAPVGVAILTDGDLVVSDPGRVAEDAPLLIRIDPDTGDQSILSQGGHLESPRHVATDTDGSILVVDGAAKKLLRVDPDSGAQTVVSEGGDFDFPVGIAVEASGTYIVADAGTSNQSRRIFRILPDTGEQMQLGPMGILRNPNGVAIRDDGLIFIADPGPLGTGVFEPGVFSVDPDTGLKELVAQPLTAKGLNGIAIHPTEDFVFYSDATEDVIFRYDPNSDPEDPTPIGLSNGDLLSQPRQIAVIVPEPGLALLQLIAVGGLAVMRRRARR